jgi:hypothetical protein
MINNATHVFTAPPESVWAVYTDPEAHVARFAMVGCRGSPAGALCRVKRSLPRNELRQTASASANSGVRPVWRRFGGLRTAGAR